MLSYDMTGAPIRGSPRAKRDKRHHALFVFGGLIAGAYKTINRRMANKNLTAAKKAKKDEFYTQMPDIENELKHYKEHFRGKTILCNCDDPYESNFFKYFASKFNTFGLKKLIATCYNGSPISGEELTLFPEEKEIPKKKAYKVEITGMEDYNGDGRIDLDDVRLLLESNKGVVTPLKDNGDFRSQECVEFLKEADIVVTNPPFSLFGEYVRQLMKYKKKFIVMGDINKATNKDVFSFIYEGKMWLGYKYGDQSFRVPDDYPDRNTRSWVDEKGKRWRSFGNICWFTNLEIPKRNEELILYKKYTPDEYVKFDNYDAINVGRTDSIPCDYNGVMGVPITFLDKYCPRQFEILGCMVSTAVDRYNHGYPYVAGKKLFARILIRKKGNI